MDGRLKYATPCIHIVCNSRFTGCLSILMLLNCLRSFSVSVPSPVITNKQHTNSPGCLGAKVNRERRREQEVRVHLGGRERPSGRKPPHQGQGHRLVDTFGVDQVTHGAFVATMQMVRAATSLWTRAERQRLGFDLCSSRWLTRSTGELDLREAAGSIRILPLCSGSTCPCPHTCLRQDTPALSPGPAGPQRLAPLVGSAVWRRNRKCWSNLSLVFRKNSWLQSLCRRTVIVSLMLIKSFTTTINRKVTVVPSAIQLKRWLNI